MKWKSLRGQLNNINNLDYFNVQVKIQDGFGPGKAIVTKIKISAFANRLAIDGDIRGIMRRTYGKPPYNF